VCVCVVCVDVRVCGACVWCVCVVCVRGVCVWCVYVGCVWRTSCRQCVCVLRESVREFAGVGGSISAGADVGVGMGV